MDKSWKKHRMARQPGTKVYTGGTLFQVGPKGGLHPVKSRHKEASFRQQSSIAMLSRSMSSKEVDAWLHAYHARNRVGTCYVLALAVHQVMPESRLFGVIIGGQMEHVVAAVGDVVIDEQGAQMIGDFKQRVETESGESVVIDPLTGWNIELADSLIGRPDSRDVNQLARILRRSNA